MLFDYAESLIYLLLNKSMLTFGGSIVFSGSIGLLISGGVAEGTLGFALANFFFFNASSF